MNMKGTKKLPRYLFMIALLLSFTLGSVSMAQGQATPYGQLVTDINKAIEDEIKLMLTDFPNDFDKGKRMFENNLQGEPTYDMTWEKFLEKIGEKTNGEGNGEGDGNVGDGNGGFPTFSVIVLAVILILVMYLNHRHKKKMQETPPPTPEENDNDRLKKVIETINGNIKDIDEELKKLTKGYGDLDAKFKHAHKMIKEIAMKEIAVMRTYDEWMDKLKEEITGILLKKTMDPEQLLKEFRESGLKAKEFIKKLIFSKDEHKEEVTILRFLEKAEENKDGNFDSVLKKYHGQMAKNHVTSYEKAKDKVIRWITVTFPKKMGFLKKNLDKQLKKREGYKEAYENQEAKASKASERILTNAEKARTNIENEAWKGKQKTAPKVPEAENVDVEEVSDSEAKLKNLTENINDRRDISDAEFKEIKKDGNKDS